MVTYAIKGGTPLRGEVAVSGAKNATVAILPATILCGDICRLENVPRISDVTTLLEILRDIGAIVRLIDATTVEVDPRPIRDTVAPYELARKIRASYYLMGAMLGRFRHAQVAMPGGCDLGNRPYDQHLKGFEAMGAVVSIDSGYLNAYCGTRLQGTPIYFDMPSVGATINVMLAAALTQGITVIENAAREPHVVDTANFLNWVGADIRGAGTNVIKIRGKERLGGGTYAIIPDQIEAGTFMAAVTATGGDVTVKNVIPKHLESITAKLLEMGVNISEGDDSVRVQATGNVKRINLKTSPYPGFPTDMQPQLTTCLCKAQGVSQIVESVSDARFRYTDELKRMGANITVDGKRAIVEGVANLSGAPLRACDLRAGAAMVIAGLSATGISHIENVHFIERGYDDIVGKFKSLGADITRQERPSTDDALPLSAG
jgi:UDP-N-acetylglucosamine 1-carboxyvinyltransferase